MWVLYMKYWIDIENPEKHLVKLKSNRKEVLIEYSGGMMYLSHVTWLIGMNIPI